MGNLPGGHHHPGPRNQFPFGGSAPTGYPQYPHVPGQHGWGPGSYPQQQIHPTPQQGVYPPPSQHQPPPFTNQQPPYMNQQPPQNYGYGPQGYPPHGYQYGSGQQQQSPGSGMAGMATGAGCMACLTCLLCSCCQACSAMTGLTGHHDDDMGDDEA